MNAPMRALRLQPNRRKLLEVILYLIAEGEKLGFPLTQYQIVKSIFLADLAHLNEFGRPITFDNYAALEFGPVPSEAYDMLKPDYPWHVHFDLRSPPWVRKQVMGSAYNYVQPDRGPDMRTLSKSDASALTEALSHVCEATFGAIRDETHQHPAYVEAWDRRGSARMAEMDYARLLKDADEDLVADLAYASKHQR